MKIWSKEEVEFLRNEYPLIGKFSSAKKLGRSEASIRQKASNLKLKLRFDTDFFKDFQDRAGKTKIGRKRPGHSKFLKDFISKHPEWREWSKERRAKLGLKIREAIKKYGHARGMKGKKHSEDTKHNLSEKYKLAWKNPKSKYNSKEYRKAKSDRQMKLMHERFKNKKTWYSRTHNGWYLIDNKKFYFRSSWEVVYARYLEFLKIKLFIKDWEYESDTFWFEKIKRGVRSYTPDFKIFLPNGKIEYHEVKGWFDKKSKTKMKRMKIYFPNIKLILIDKFIYKDIFKNERLYPDAVLVPNTKTAL